MANSHGEVGGEHFIKSRETKMQSIDDYSADQKDHLCKFIDNVTRRAKAANDESKQLKELFEEEKQVMQRRLIESEKVRERYRKELNDLKKEELDDTKTSKPTGDELTDNNPKYIPDLSDINRPTKLAERFSELFDSPWTDAFEQLQSELDSDNEEQIINILLQILLNISDFCYDRAKRQIDDLKNALFCSDSITDADGRVPANVIKHLNDCRKATSSVSKEHVFELYLSSLRKEEGQLKYALKIKSFVKECVEICWLMVIQDPPLVFASNGKGEIFNTELYKAYTKNGMYVKFVVWPAMRLCKDGPVLAKGVAQGESGYKGKDKLATDYVDVHNPYTGRKLDKRTYTKGQLVSTSNNANYQVYSDYKEQSIERNIATEMEKARHRRAKSEEERRRTEQPILTKMSTGTRSVWKPHREYDREPTRDEMRTYFNYFDRREYGKARYVLGGKAYFRCMQYEHKRHMYVN